MDEQKIFIETIESLKELALSNNYYLTKQDVENAFGESKLNEKQKEVIYSYMKAHNITVEDFEGDEGIFEESKEEIIPEGADEEEKKFLEMYSEDLKHIRKYSDSEIFKLYKTMKTDEKAREEFITANLKNVVEWVEPLKDKGASMGDLIGEGNLSLITATNDLRMEEFEEPSQVIEFLKEEITEYVMIYLNAQNENNSIENIALDKVNEVSETVGKLYAKLGRDVKIEEIAKEMNVDAREILNIINVSSNKIKNVDYTE